MSLKTRRLLPVLGLLLLLLGAGGVSPAGAQAPGSRAQDTEAASDPAPPISPEQANALADLLGDEKARDAIIQQLEQIAGTGRAVAADAAAPETESVSVVRRVAETSRTIAETLVTHAMVFWNQIARAPQTLKAVSDVPTDVVIEAVTDLLLVIVTTIVLFLLLRRGAKVLFRRMGEVAQGLGLLRTFGIVIASVLIDAAVVLLAWAGGYLLALLAFGETGEIGIRQTLYLNSFLIVEMVKVVVRAILSPNAASLRPISIPDRGARVLSFWIMVSVSLVGYGQLLIVPIINQNVSYLTGNGIANVLSMIAVAVLIGLAIANRRAVSDWLLNERQMAEKTTVTRFAAQYWHVPVLIYLIGLFIIVMARPGGVLIPLLIVSGQILAVVVIGMVISDFLKRAVSRGVHLPGAVRSRLPLLERRLNTFVPRALTILRLLIGLIIIGFSVHLVGLFDVEAWLNSQIGVRLTGTLLMLLLILALAFGVWLAVSSWIDFRLNPEFGSIPTARERTLLTLLRNASTIVLIVITLMFVLSEVGIDIAPLIASAGVLGLAIGFGAQKLVQDIITGVFIQFENAINVGDIVTVGGTTGTVERLTIRSVSLRDLQGVFHIIPFSSVDMVSNFMREFGYYLCDMGVAYRENLDEVKAAMTDCFKELRENPAWSKDILDDLQWMGLQSFGDSAIILRSRIKCMPGRQFAVGRAYNEILKRVFDERGIEIPFPHQTIYIGEDKDGKSPPLRILNEKPAKS